MVAGLWRCVIAVGPSSEFVVFGDGAWWFVVIPDGSSMAVEIVVEVGVKVEE